MRGSKRATSGQAMSAPAPPASPWRPGRVLHDSVSISDIAAALAFGQGDSSYNKVAELLASRNCKTVGDLRDWTQCEFHALLRTTSELKKGRHVYLAGLQSATQVVLGVEGMKVKAEGKGKCGGDTTLACAKIAPSDDFNLTKWVPDALVYDGVPRASEQQFMSEPDEKLYLDKLWLCAQADPEPSLGDYLPDCMVPMLAKIHRQLKLAEFQPKHAGKPGKEKARRVNEVIKNKWSNGRHYGCKRIVLSEEFRDEFSKKTQDLITFTNDPGELGPDNKRNAAMRAFVEMRKGARGRTAIAYPSDPSTAAGDAENVSASTANAAAAAASAAAASAAAAAAAAQKPSPKSSSPEQPPDEEPPSSLRADSSDEEEAANSLDLEVLDGAVLMGPRASEGPPPPPKAKKPAANRAASGSAVGGAQLSKKDQLKAKKRQKQASQPKHAKKARTEDSSVEDSSDEDGDSSEGGGEEGGGTVPAPKPKPPPKPKRQTVLKPKFKVEEIAVDHAAVTSPAAEPALTPANAASRFVFVPASQFGAAVIGGYVARIQKVGRDKQATTSVQFKDADGKMSTEHFTFERVASSFKPLT